MPETPMVAVFDTSFFQTLPQYSYMYPIPYEYYEKYGIRKYGFHGTSHRYLCERAAAILGEDLNEIRLITCHFGQRLFYYGGRPWQTNRHHHGLYPT